MGRSTHNKHTQNLKSDSKIKIKTDDKILKSLNATDQKETINNIQSLGTYKDQIVGEHKVIEHINNLEEQTSISEILKAINDFSVLCSKLSDWYVKNEMTIKNCEAFTNDILHEFELGSPKDIGRAYRSYTKLRKARKDRRKAKNENRILAPLHDYIKQNPTLVKDMIRIREKCAGIEFDLSNASYSYRTNEDID